MNRLLLKLINIHYLVIHYLLIVHSIKKKQLNHYRGKDCMKKFCKDLREHATKIINYEKKKMIPLITEEKNNIIMNKKFVIYARRI